jgi:hypothetical protein
MGLCSWPGGLESFTVLGRGFPTGKFGVTDTLCSSIAAAGIIALS